MAIILIVLQIALWLVGGAWVVANFGIESFLVKVLVYGVTGISSAIFVTVTGKALGIIKSDAP